MTGPTPVPPRISLLHATYKRVGGPLEVRDAWLTSAVNPAAIEYVVSMDEDDPVSVGATEGVPRIVNPSMGGAVTAVRNWNAAAAASTGDLLVVIADDLFPPEGWDAALIEMIGTLNPARTPFVVKVADSPDQGDVLLRHPVVSRSFYARFGLFSPSYRGVYCDNDFTARAYWRSAIVDGRSLRLEHRHPNVAFAAASSESHDRLNRREEYERGKAEYLAAWSRWKRSTPPRLVPNATVQNLSHWKLLVIQRRLRAASNASVVNQGLRRAATMLSAGCCHLAHTARTRSRLHKRALTENARRALVRRHPDLPAFFLVDERATRHATLSETVGNLVTVLHRLRDSCPPVGSAPASRPLEPPGTGLRVLVVDPLMPMYDKAAGSLRLFRILGLMAAAGHQVTFLARGGVGDERYRAELEAMGISVYAGDPERLRRRGLPADGRPLDLVGLLQRGRFDIAWLDFYEAAEQYLPEIRAHSPSTRILVDTVDVHWLRHHRQAELEGNVRGRLQARTVRFREETVYRAADGLVAVTPDDEAALQQLAPDVPTYVLGTIHPLEEPGPGAARRSGVVFVGNFNHPPNVDAAVYLVSMVMPLVWESNPSVAVTIVGTNPPPPVRQLAGARVTVTGHVPHTRPYLDAARVSVAPLRFGAGMKGKVGEALAAGLPVVTTPIGAEGMGLEHGAHALIAENAAGLAAAIVRLHVDAALWTRLSEGGRAFVEHRYGLAAAQSRLAGALQQVMTRTAFVWVPDWSDKDGIDAVLHSYAEAFAAQEPVALVVGVDAAGNISPEEAVADLAAGLARLGRDPRRVANIAVTPFPGDRPEALISPGAASVSLLLETHPV